MKQLLIQAGKASVEEVPLPQVLPGTALVRTSYSCISIGTEMHGVRMSGQPLWKRTLREPAKVKKALAMMAQDGLSETLGFISRKFDAMTPTGYSTAGTVVAVGEGITDLTPGDRVACAGAQCAYHAEYVVVPRNLICPLPDGLELKHASSVALGAIALQGVRRAQATLGETFVVLGLGVIGQLTAQLLRLNGCRTIGIDLDRKRIEIARQLGSDYGFQPEDGADAAAVQRVTDGIGADGVIITAASPSDAVIASAFAMCRKKGRVVLVGDVGLHLNRADFYEKEIDFLISASYGPGRYDRLYEESNLDYPLAYVRWTENRNMSEYLRLLAEGKLELAKLTTAEHPLSQAPAVYDELKRGEGPLVAFLSYPEAGESPRDTTVANSQARPGRSGTIGLAVIGAGEFAQASVLPNLQKLGSHYRLRCIVDASGARATGAARQFGAELASSTFDDVLADQSIDAVYITTRHHLHAKMTLAALRAGKHVLVEKPLALTAEETKNLEQFVGAQGDGSPVLLTGFNRRFSPYAQRLRELVGARSPMMLAYRMNAGAIPASHWVHGPEGGGRNRGEACHIYDLFTFLTNARTTTVQASVIPPRRVGGTLDNFSATITFDDGSIASLLYTSLGSKDFPKETMEAFVDGKVVTLSDYRSLTVSGSSARGVETKRAEKGHREELIAFAECIQRGGAWPIPMWQQVQATKIALDVERQLAPQQPAVN